MSHYTKGGFLSLLCQQVIAQTLPFNEIVGIREMFEEFDKDGNGCISVAELREGLEKKGANLAIGDLQHLVDAIDGNHLV